MWNDTGMARFLFIMLPLESHLHPALAIAAELERTGHMVAWCGAESDLRPLAGPDAVIYPTGKRYYRRYQPGGMAAMRSLWQDYLLPVNRFIRDAADAAVTDWAPHVVVADQYALAGAVAAHRHRVRWATLSTGVLELIPPPLPWLPDYLGEQLGQVRQMAGLPPDPELDLRFSPDLVIFLTSRELIGPTPLPAQTVLTGPAIGRRAVPGGPPFRWDAWDAGQHHVLVTIGTVLDGLLDRGAAGFYTRMASALAPMAGKLQAVLVAPPATVTDPPQHVLVVPRAPVLQLLPRLDAVVCHAGLGTVTEALTHGVPLVVAPVAPEQLIVAQQVTAAGAGIEISFAEATPAQLAAAVAAVLSEPSYRANARRVGESLRAGGGAAAAARHLAALAGAAAATS
jgi:zeaxanthin glucosyltransferase